MVLVFEFTNLNNFLGVILMSEQARKVFNIEEQVAKDILTAIKVIFPVIPLIRERGKIEREREEACNNAERLSIEIKTLKDALDILSDNRVIKPISEACEQKMKLLEEFNKKANELTRICDDLKAETVLYRDYAKDYFSDLMQDDILEELVFPKLKTRNQYLTILFLSYSYTNVVSDFIVRFLADKNIDPIIFTGGWKYMLEKLKANEL